jgi:protein-disulfide isomerase
MDSSNNKWFAVSLGLMGVIAGFAVASYTKGGSIGVPSGGSPSIAQAPAAPAAAAQPPAAQPSGKPPAPVDAKTDRIRGDLSKAKVAVIEYSDFECPFCKRHFTTVQQILSTYGDKVAFVYRDFPLSFHQNAQKEAEAGRCVNELGGNDAFWRYHDYVFTKTTSNGTGFPLDQLPVAAKEAGVDVAKFQSCLDSGKFAKAVADQEAEGQSAGVSGTPGNFIVDLATQKSTTLEGAVPFSSFQAAIDPLVK